MQIIDNKLFININLSIKKPELVLTPAWHPLPDYNRTALSNMESNSSNTAKQLFQQEVFAC